MPRSLSREEAEAGFRPSVPESKAIVLATTLSLAVPIDCKAYIKK